MLERPDLLIVLLVLPQALQVVQDHPRVEPLQNV
jgi:hypothetical protein